MKVAVDCDEAGLPLKKIVVDHLRSLGVDVRVEGPFSAVAVWLALLEQGERALSIERLDLIATGRSDGTIAASARVRGFSARLATMATGGAR